MSAQPEHVEMHMRDSDAFAWYMEKDPLLRSTVVCVLLLDGTPDWDRLPDRLLLVTYTGNLSILRRSFLPLATGFNGWVSQSVITTREAGIPTVNSSLPYIKALARPRRS